MDALADALSNFELSDAFYELLLGAVKDIADLKARVTALEP